MNIPYKYPVHWNEVNGSVDEKDGRTLCMIRFADDLAERRKAQEKGDFLVALLNGEISMVPENEPEHRKPGRPRKVTA